MPETAVLYDPGSVQIRGMRSAVAKAILESGELALIQNMRWDTHLLTARGGTVSVFALPSALTGATVVDLWSGELNGSQYIVVAYLLNSKIELWASDNGAGLYRISQVGGNFGGTTGDTRFATSTGMVRFQPVRMPRYSIIGSPIPSKDVLIISNGTDDNLVWNPAGTQNTVAISGATNATPIVVTSATHNLNDGDTVLISGVLGNTAANGSFWVDKLSATTFGLYKDEALTLPVAGNGAYTSGGNILQDMKLAPHKNVTVPADWKMYSQTATMRDFWTVAAAAATHTYLVSGVINQARWKFGDSATAPYTGANTCLLMTLTTAAAAGDVAAFYMSGDNLNMNRAIGFLVEGTPANIDKFFSRSKIDAGKENVAYGSVSTWSTIFDPSGTVEKQRKTDLIIVNLDNDRYLVVLPTDHIAASNRTAYHLRFTYDGVAPTANATITILAILGCGDIPGGSTWEIAYGDQFGFSDAFGIQPSLSISAKFEDLGGPDSYTGGKREELLPIDSGVLYDYKLSLPISQGADVITGGLNGEPSHVHFYLKLAEETDAAKYLYSLKTYDPGSSGGSYAWAKLPTGLLSYVHNTGDVTGSYAVDESDRDPFRESPSEWQHALPPFLASAYANSRLFVGNIYDTTNSRRQPGMVYASGKQSPFAITDVPIVRQAVDESAGTRDDYAGETIQAIVTCAAQAAGRSMVHVVTTKSFNVQGFAGGFVGSADSATDLGTHTRISDNGTNAPRCVAESNGRIVWPDQFGQHMEYWQGQLRNVSRLSVDDKFKNIPTGRLASACAIIHKDRYYNPYTIAAGSTNARCLVRNLILDAWEADDLPPASIERMCVFYDSTLNGSGQRLLIAASTGVIYEYDKAGQDELGSAIAIRLTFAEFMERLPGAKSLIVLGVWIAADAQSNTLTIDRYYRHQTGLSRSTCSLAAGRAWDQGKPTVISGFADARGERGMAAYLDIYGNMTTGTVLWHIGCQTKTESEDDAVVGN